MTDSARLRAVPLFSELADSDLQHLRVASERVVLGAGRRLFEEGDMGDRAYVILAGEIEIVKRSDHREVLLAVRKEGEVIGEMALLREAPRIATAQARTDAELLAIPKADLDALLASSPSALRALFEVLLDRWEATQDQLRQSERMAQLGTLTAGLAHELNNPAAAVARAAEQLGEGLGRLRRAEHLLHGEHGGGLTVDAVLARTRDPRQHPLDPLDRADLEAGVEEVLDRRGIEEAWKLAPGLVEAGITPSAVDSLAEEAGERTAALLEAVEAHQDVTALLHEVEVGTRRMIRLVGALKSYTYLDQAPVQAVDLVEGLEDTLLILGAQVRGIDVRREYAQDLPTIEGMGPELNQVWTNLVSNAADAVRESGRADGVIVLRARPDGPGVVVEVEDNGVGIPPESLDRVFDAFYTTKPPGAGTGLGLHISYRVVVLDHRGSLTVTSSPGRTVFRVELPLRMASGEDPGHGEVATGGEDIES